MKLIDKNILLISPESWDHIFVSKHHYATYLAQRNNSVFFLNPPSKKRLQKKTTTFKGVTIIDYKGFIKGLRFLHSSVQQYFIRKKYKELENICEVKFDIIWSFDNSVFFDFTALPKSVLKISHIVDLNQDFQTAKAASTSTICFGTTEQIIGKLRKYNPNSFFINHGYNNVIISKPSISTLPGTNQTKCIYAGNLSMEFIDWLNIKKCTDLNPTIDFIFIGPSHENIDIQKNITHHYKKECLKKSNCFFIGSLKSNQLIEYYALADILMVCYQEEYHNDQANPHKMMEYLGSGKVVVATNTKEYRALERKNLIFMSVSNSEYPKLFTNTVNNLASSNSKEKMLERKKNAMNNTYDKQIDKIESRISMLQ